MISEQQVGCPVNSHNEWDPLEEVIVGRLEGANIPPNHVIVTLNVPSLARKLLRVMAGRRYPRFVVNRAQQEVSEFIHILEAEGVTVRRPDLMDFHVRFKTPYWSTRGFCTACPRDVFMIVGNEIIETPSCWRSRLFERYAYQNLFREYYLAGAKWIAAPVPRLADDLYDSNFELPLEDEPLRYVINENEPVFDAADFVRCGTDLFVIRSNVTNYSGIDWLRRHLGDTYRIHELPLKWRQPMHIDSTFVPLAPGKVLVNPDYLDLSRLPSCLKSWDILVAPRPDPTDGIGPRFSAASAWTSINVLMLDEKRVVVDRSQVSLIQAFKDWGFEPIPCPFLFYGPFGGSFHCATLDVRRRGSLQSYT